MNCTKSVRKEKDLQLQSYIEKIQDQVDEETKETMRVLDLYVDSMKHSKDKIISFEEIQDKE